MIVTDMLAEIYGYDKYSEVTRELAIRGTYCDLATRIDGKFQMLIEANQGVECVALSNGWR